MKKQGLPDFAIIDAFSVVKDDIVFIECNYCDHLSKDANEAVTHFDMLHSDIRDKNYPKKELDEKTGRNWLVPKEETIEHSYREVTPIDFYFHFYGYCVFDSVPLTEEEKKIVYLDNKTQKWQFKQEEPKRFIKQVSVKRRRRNVYSYNVGELRLEIVKELIKEKFGLDDDDIEVKKNKKGNYAVFYFR